MSTIRHVHNAAFAVTPGQDSSAFVPDRTGRVRDIPVHPGGASCGQRQHHQVACSLSLQIPPSPMRAHFVRATVRVHEYPDGHLAILHGPHRVADYDPEGKPRNDAKLAA